MYIWPDKSVVSMNKRQKGQVVLATLFAVLFIVWLFMLFMPGEEVDKITRWFLLLGLIGWAGGVLSMVLSYRDEEKNKKKPE